VCVKNRVRALLIAAIAAVVVPVKPARATGGGTWVDAPPLAVAPSFAEAVTVPDGRVIVPGGNHLHYLGATAPAALVLEKSVWLPTQPMNSPHAKHTVSLLRDGRVLVTGGEGRASPGARGNVVTVSEVYDPATGRWTPTPPMATDVPFNHSATLLEDGRVLVAGGSYVGVGRSGVLADAQLFDPASGGWTATAEMADPRTYHSSALLADGRVLVVGGHDGSGVPRDTAEIWDPTTATWVPTAGMRFAHHSETNAAALLPDGRVVVVGGTTVLPGGARGATNRTQMYDPRRDRWTESPTLPGPPRTDHVVVAVRGGRVLVAGGLTADPALPADAASALADAYLFDTRRCRWDRAASMAAARSNAAATVLDDGSVLVVGGQHGVRDGAQMNETRVERFLVPGAPRWRLRGGRTSKCTS
jgi:N-acetylneuraminic acid mutarotase